MWFPYHTEISKHHTVWQGIPYSMEFNEYTRKPEVTALAITFIPCDLHSCAYGTRPEGLLLRTSFWSKKHYSYEISCDPACCVCVGSPLFFVLTHSSHGTCLSCQYHNVFVYSEPVHRVCVWKNFLCLMHVTIINYSMRWGWKYGFRKDVRLTKVIAKMLRTDLQSWLKQRFLETARKWNLTGMR